MTEWEYAVEIFDGGTYADTIAEECDGYGRDNFEAVGILPPMNGDTGFRILFKRPMPVCPTCECPVYRHQAHCPAKPVQSSEQG